MVDRIGKYEVRSVLGRGKSSVVYLAYDEFLNSDLAVKVYLPESEPQLANAASVQFVSEASLAGKLVHPHIVTIVDAVAEPNLRYVAMEYVPGGNLQRHTIRDRLLSVDDVVQIGFKCCGALDYAHRHGVVHRDVADVQRARGRGHHQPAGAADEERRRELLVEEAPVEGEGRPHRARQPP